MPEAPRSIAADIAKWLVPSATVLFAVTGYVISQAQSDLLGVALPADPQAYAQNATDFLGDIPRLLSETLESFGPAFGDVFGPDVWLWLLGLALLVAGLALPRLGRLRAAPMARALDLRWATPAALALLIALKFTALDLPLGKIRDVVLSHGSTTSLTVGEAALRTTFAALAQGDAAGGAGFTRRTGSVQQTFIAQMGPRAAPQARKRPISGWFAGRTQALWDAVLCSRISLDRPDDPHDEADVLQCHPQRPQYLWRLRGAFLLRLAMAGGVAALAIAILRRPGAGAGVVSLAVLALVYDLTVADAYGKLIKPTDFDFGVVRLAKPPLPAAGAAADAPAQPDELDGLVLNRDGAGSELLVLERGTCGVVGGPRYAAVRLAWLSNAQVLSVQEIYRQDVISWAAFSEQACPTLSTYSTSDKN